MPTLPDFLERRFNRHCRDWLAVLSIFSAIVIHIGVALYTAALVLCGMLGLGPDATIIGIPAMMFFIIVLGVLTGVYTMIGGLLAVVWTESMQTRAPVGRGPLHYGSGLLRGRRLVGTDPHPGHARPIRWPGGRRGDRCNWGTGNFLSMFRGDDDPSHQPWYGDPAGLSGDRHLVLVLRPDDRAAGVGRAG